MFRWLIRTEGDVATALVRLALGGVMFAHAAQKVFGWFGGHGFSATVDHFAAQLGMPAPLGVAIIAVEFAGAVGLVLGLLGRLAALGVAAIMTGAIALVHARFGFFMNWFGTKAGEGFEFHLLALAMAAAIVLRGSGALSADRCLYRSGSKEEPSAA